MSDVGASEKAGGDRPPGQIQVGPIVVVDDHAALRRGVSSMLDSEPDLGPVATAATAREALELVEAIAPQLVVLDFHLPDEDGLSLCLRFKGSRPALVTLIYSAFADEYLLPLAMIAGADGLLSKDADPEQLCSAVRELGAGGRLLPTASQAAMEWAAGRLDPEDLPILGMLAHATPPAEIGATLGIDERWLVNRRWAMLERLRGGRRRRTEPTAASPFGFPDGLAVGLDDPSPALSSQGR